MRMFMNVRENTIPAATICPPSGRTAPSMRIGTRKNVNSRVCAAFTLVELVLVITIMTILIALVFPSLKGFFRGRNLDNEARRFLSLTRYGQSRAISEGVPVELWINPRQGSYGLQALSG